MANPTPAQDLSSPQRTIALLSELAALGFSDEHLRLVHHFPDITVRSHLSYCESRSAFRNGESNAKVQARLELVLRAYRQGGFQSREARDAVFAALARAAAAEVPL